MRSVSKIGALRAKNGSWLPAYGTDALARAVGDNLRKLGVEALHVVDLRTCPTCMDRPKRSVAAPLKAMTDLQRRGSGAPIGLSSLAPTQVKEGRGIAEIAACPTGTLAGL